MLLPTSPSPDLEILDLAYRVNTSADLHPAIVCMPSATLTLGHLDVVVVALPRRESIGNISRACAPEAIAVTEPPWEHRGTTLAIDRL